MTAEATQRNSMNFNQGFKTITWVHRKVLCSPFHLSDSGTKISITRKTCLSPYLLLIMMILPSVIITLGWKMEGQDLSSIHQKVLEVKPQKFTDIVAQLVLFQTGLIMHLALSVTIARWIHPFPFRTRKLSTLAPMVLHG